MSSLKKKMAALDVDSLIRSGDGASCSWLLHFFSLAIRTGHEVFSVMVEL